MTRLSVHAPDRLTRSLPVTAPALVTLVAVLLGHDRRALWRDEYATWYAATLSPADLKHLLSNVDAVFAPFYLFTRAWITLFGDSLTSLRLPSALAMAVTAGLLGALGRRLFSPGTGLVAGLLFAVLPSVSRYGEEARPYAFALAATAGATLLLLRALERPDLVRRWVPYALTVTLIGWSHLVALTVLGAHALAVLATAAPRLTALRRWTAAAVCGGLPVVPLLLLGRGQSRQIGWIETREESIRSFVTAVFGSLTVGLLVLALGVLAIRLADPRRRLLLAWALLPPALVLAATPLVNLMLSRYLLFTLPAWVLLAAVTLRRGAALGVTAFVAAARGRFAPVTPRSGRSWAVVAAGLAVLGALALPGQVDARTLPAGNQPDLRTAAQIIKARLEPGDAIAYGGTTHGGPRVFRRGMAFELRDVTAPKDVFVSVPSQATGTFNAVECADPAACARGVKRLWLVTSAPDGNLYGWLPATRAELLRTEFTARFEQRIQGVAVVLLERSGQPLPQVPAGAEPAALAPRP
ncbi:glycosyltransferase family 39 protein [Catellatospora sp. KI3]|uniref:glycosyltransferase family 39 protein n=1 Tax=Catellatospora sp. KI3 TaxID=3041620 RepID=UPI002482A380|nr:glycosyltransferase family 39 protein [Catellatospora sp. KI3]MDI1465499.1 glycosyltransferase family 39 protein [Catellatospora sp. KI3]